MEKLSIEKKTKLIYSGELLLIAVVLIVFAILKILGIIPTNPTRLLIYNILTTVGGASFIFDFVAHFIFLHSEVPFSKGFCLTFTI